jgi:hypothetical protein
MNTKSQSKAILAALQAGDALTHLDAERRFGCSRIAARIKDLKDGKLNRTKYDIQTTMESQDGKRFASYRMMTTRLRAIENIPAFPRKVESPQALF